MGEIMPTVSSALPETASPTHQPTVATPTSAHSRHAHISSQSSRPHQPTVATPTSAHSRHAHISSQSPRPHKPSRRAILHRVTCAIEQSREGCSLLRTCSFDVNSEAGGSADERLLQPVALGDDLAGVADEAVLDAGPWLLLHRLDDEVRRLAHRRRVPGTCQINKAPVSCMLYVQCVTCGAYGDFL